MRHILNNIAAFAFLIGVAPVFLTRTWRARWVAIIFGTISVGLAVCFVLGVRESQIPSKVFGRLELRLSAP